MKTIFLISILSLSCWSQEVKSLEQLEKEKKDIEQTILSERFKSIDPKYAVKIQKKIDSINLIKLEKEVIKNKSMTRDVVILNTNFSIPLARFNFAKGTQDKKGNITLFNSIGAGYGYSWGELKTSFDENGEIENEEFTNKFGMYLGFLFSAGTGEDTKNVFAPVVHVNLLDFQLGLGYELGTIEAHQKRTFLTLSYAIPIYKLKKGAYWIWFDKKNHNYVNQNRLGE